ncbi:MAG: hypothetical protein KUG79_12925 [Pseudomonadales bacterium]|nr:hypothetical protein [Pseudomonadales bacterium]
MQISPTTVSIQPVAASSTALNLPPESSPAKTEAQQTLLAQVIKIMAKTGMVDVKVLNTQAVIQVQSSIPLRPGQLILVNLSSEGIGLQANAKQAAEHLFQKLLPLQGSVKDALASLLSSRRILSQAAGDKISTSAALSTATNAQAQAGKAETAMNQRPAPNLSLIHI